MSFFPFFDSCSCRAAAAHKKVKQFLMMDLDFCTPINSENVTIAGFKEVQIMYSLFLVRPISSKLLPLACT